MTGHSEADTCRLLITPKLQAAGWDNEPHSLAEQRTITDGRIVPNRTQFIRKAPRRVDYLLRYTRDIALAVVEAKPEYKTAADGVQQAREYAEMLGLYFAYASNGTEIIEIDYFAGTEKVRPDFASPAELWQRYQAGRQLAPDQAQSLLTPSYPQQRENRYYQQIAINRAVEAVLAGDKRLLLTLATGTGKTRVAFQTCWRLWNARWNRDGAPRKPRILYLADRNILIDDPKDKDFAPFGDARYKIDGGEVVKSREMYFAIYQALAEDERRNGVFREYPPDFFDLIIVDECHRGSARSDSSWRDILEYFAPATQLGMTATPISDDTRDTYRYFGNPLYTYSLRQGIEDGFLAPYRVHRVVTQWDAIGWRPSVGDVERYGRDFPEGEFGTKDFERIISLPARTRAIAAHLTKFLKETDRFAKTIVFCVDQEHASQMRAALIDLNTDIVQQYPDYVCRVTSDEEHIGRGFLGRFQDVETRTPTILTTSQMLTTGVDAPTCKNVAIARVVGSMPEFKQIIGRGTRVRDDYGKLWFSILDYTGSATANFADPDFDGDPVLVTNVEINEDGAVIAAQAEEFAQQVPEEPYMQQVILEPPSGEPRKFYYDGGRCEIIAHVVHELDPDGNQLRVVHYADYTAERVRTMFSSPLDLREQWQDADTRRRLIEDLKGRGIDFAELASQLNQPDADPLDLLCHLAYSAPLRTRRERAQLLKQNKPDFFMQFGPQAGQVLDELLEKYAEYGDAQFVLPDVLKVPPLSAHGQPADIIALFGGAQSLRLAVEDLQRYLYAP